MAIGTRAVVEPVWLDVRPIAEAGCAACAAAALPAASRVFVYRDVCFARPPVGELLASVKTLHSSEGPRRVRLQLFTDGGPLPAHDTQQTLRRRCTGGSMLSVRHCGGGACGGLDDRCAADERAVVESETSTIVSSGVGSECFSVVVTVGDAQDEPALVGLEIVARAVRPGSE